MSPNTDMENKDISYFFMKFHVFFMNFMIFYDLVDVSFGEIRWYNGTRVLKSHAHITAVYRSLQLTDQSTTSRSCLPSVSTAKHGWWKFMKFHEIHEIS